jgi:RNA polymerase sigma-70 factor (ECF subfamily)
MSEHELVEACLKNDRKAQKALYDQYSRQMMAICLRYAGNASAASDIMQEGFITVFEKLRQFKGEGALGGWIRRIMVNTALLYLRREKKFAFHEEPDDHHDAFAAEADVFDKLGTEALLKLIGALPDGYRTVFNLFAIEGFSHKEIADQLGISESTSKTQFFKAKKHLQERVAQLETK